MSVHTYTPVCLYVVYQGWMHNDRGGEMLCSNLPTLFPVLRSICRGNYSLMSFFPPKYGHT